MKDLTYLAGPMAGYPLNNAQAFFRAAHLLKAKGYTVINPLQLDLLAGMDITQDLNEEERHTVLRRDIRVLTHCSRIILLPGWRESQGACMEAMIAANIGLEMLELIQESLLVTPTEYDPACNLN